MNTSLPDKFSVGNLLKNNWYVFLTLWATVFILYLPAAKAGEVGDFTGWLYTIRYAPFWDFINRPDSLSLYQFTQLVTYGIYKVIGYNPLLWHFLQVSLHAVNCLLVFTLAKNILADSKVDKAVGIAFAASFLFAVCPLNTEVVVHESCYHYLQGFLIVLLILRWVQQYHYTQKRSYIWWAAILYGCSTYSLEVFYFTPWFTLSLALYYRLVIGYDKAILRKTVLYFFVPQLLLYFAHVAVLHYVINLLVAHVAPPHDLLSIDFLCKMPKLLYHVIFMGRYFSNDIRQAVYRLCEHKALLSVVYLSLLAVCAYLVFFFKQTSLKWKAAGLFLIWMLAMVLIATPFPIPTIQLVGFDRYTYFMQPFIFLLLAIVFSHKRLRRVSVVLFAVYSLCNMYCLTVTNNYWKKSAYLVKRLVQPVSLPPGKTILLLNPPENMNGILMLGSQPNSVWKMMYDLYNEPKITNTVYDVVSYNLNTLEDGAHVRVTSDSTVTVTLNQWGGWWWYKYLGANSYENEAYKLIITDAGHCYDLILKHPAAGYQLMYEVNGNWKIVDWNKRNVDQY